MFLLPKYIGERFEMSHFRSDVQIRRKNDSVEEFLPHFQNIHGVSFLWLFATIAPFYKELQYFKWFFVRKFLPSGISKEIKKAKVRYRKLRTKLHISVEFWDTSW